MWKFCFYANMLNLRLRLNQLFKIMQLRDINNYMFLKFKAAIFYKIKNAKKCVYVCVSRMIRFLLPVDSNIASSFSDVICAIWIFILKIQKFKKCILNNCKQCLQFYLRLSRFQSFVSFNQNSTPSLKR